WIAVRNALQRLAKSGLVVLPCVGQRLIALEYLADDFNVLAGAQEWLVVSDSVPALHHLWAGRPDTKDEATARERVERHRSHRRHGGRACRHLHYRSTHLNPCRPRQHPRGGSDGVRTVSLRGPDRIKA